MGTSHSNLNRRVFMGAAGAATLLASTAGRVSAQSFPSSPINVFIPTREGGALDRNYRAFSAIWKKYLEGAVFEPSFYPGAGGRVGYQFYMGKAEADAHNLVFGSMGSIALNWLLDPPTDYSYPADLEYFQRVDHDPMVVFVAENSPFTTIGDVIDEARKRTVNVASSRLAHPATIGMLELGSLTGSEYNVVPLSGGRNTLAGVVTGEFDIGCIGGGTVLSRGEAVRTLAVFDNQNSFGDALPGLPTINESFGIDMPPLASSRAFAIHTKAIANYPDRFERLKSTMRPVFEDPEYRATIEQSGQPWGVIRDGGAEECSQYMNDILALGEKYISYLKG